jgi:3-isopropylmalate/(R)-2-methylmalate dehydratase small subunit
MKPFTTLSSRVIPLPLKDIDTDMLIPAQYLTSISKEGYGENLFRRLRDQDSAFPLNLEKFKNGQILVTQSNFGCGSSREHAVWALLGWGIRVVIAPSFADIFHSNSAKNGLLLVTLPQETVTEILDLATAGDYDMTVNLEAQTVTLRDGAKLRFDYDPFRKACLLQGYDDMDYLLAERPAIEAYQKAREKELFYSTTQANHVIE